MSKPGSSTSAFDRSFFATDLTVAVILGVFAFLLQMVTNGRYGYFRDELYFLAAGNHLAWGYVDFPPMVALIARASRLLFGDSLHAIRFFPAVAYGAEVFLTGLITRELGGRRFAVFLACGSVLLAPVIVGNATRLSMNPFEPLFWMGCVYFLLLASHRNQPRLLLFSGVLLGLGIENKYSTLFFIAALVAGLLLTSDRRLLRTRWFWIAVAIVILLAMPNFLWQVLHHFPTLEDLRNVKRTHKNIELPPLPFLRQQIMMLNPYSAIVWIAGLGFLLFDREGRRHRSLGIAYLVFLAVMMALKGKDYYLAPIYPMLFAAGGVFWEKLSELPIHLRWTRIVVSLLVFSIGIIALPIALPVLPVEKIVPYMSALGIKPSRTEVREHGILPQQFGDEFGWRTMVSEVARVYYSLPPAERAQTAILAGNYGEAGAIDFFGPHYGLPQSISAHQNYYYWGPRQYTGQSLILLQWNLPSAQRWCGSVDQGPSLAPPYGMREEYYTILVCHNLKMPLTEAWPRLKVWN